SHQCHRRSSALGDSKVSDSAPDLLSTPESLVIIDFSSLTNDLRLHRKLGGNKVRIHRNTVATHTTAGLQNSDTWMLVGKADKLPSVNPRLVTNQRKLVGKSNLNVTASVLSQFAHFGSSSIGAMQLAFDELLIKLTRLLRRGLVHPTNDSIVVYQLIHHVTGQHSLRAVSDE